MRTNVTRQFRFQELNVHTFVPGNETSRYPFIYLYGYLSILCLCYASMHYAPIEWA